MSRFTEATFESDREVLQRARGGIQSVITRLIAVQRMLIEQGEGGSIQAGHIAHMLRKLADADELVLQVKAESRSVNE